MNVTNPTYSIHMSNIFPLVCDCVKIELTLLFFFWYFAASSAFQTSIKYSPHIKFCECLYIVNQCKVLTKVISTLCISCLIWFSRSIRTNYFKTKANRIWKYFKICYHNITWYCFKQTHCLSKTKFNRLVQSNLKYQFRINVAYFRRDLRL